ncbi:MAG: PHP domain-containing protein [Bacillota bacterium]
MRIFADYHTHTVHSHGRGTILENVLAARRQGLRQVGIADHAPGSWSWIGVRNAGEYDEIRREIELVNSYYPDIEVLCGAECNVMTVDGQLDLAMSDLKRLDIVLCGLHPTIVPPTWSDAWNLVGTNWLARYSSRATRRARTINTKALISAVEHYPIDIITHPGYKFSIDTAELARACARRGTSLELNASHHQLSVDFVEVAAAQGVTFVLGSDAHRPNGVGQVGRAVAIAERAGLDHRAILNAEDDGEHRRPVWRKRPMARELYAVREKARTGR